MGLYLRPERNTWEALKNLAIRDDTLYIYRDAIEKTVTQAHTSESQSPTDGQTVRRDHHSFYRFWKDDDGQDLIEYGFLTAFISIISIVTIKVVGTLVKPLIQKILDAF